MYKRIQYGDVNHYRDWAHEGNECREIIDRDCNITKAFCLK